MILNRKEERNVYVDKLEANNVRHIGFNFVIYVFVGASLANDYTGYHSMANSFTTFSECANGLKYDYSVTTPSLDLMKIENMNKLKKMKEFEPDWNGNGGKAFSTAAIDLFEKVIDSILKQPKIAPTGNESLLLQYEKNDNSLLAFDVSIKSTKMVIVPNGNYDLAKEEAFAGGDINSINSAVIDFYGLA